MRWLSVHDLKPEDSLLLTFDGTFDQQAALESELEPFLQAFEEYADGWESDVIKGKRQRKYARSSFWKALEERRDENSTGLGLYRTKWPALDMSLYLRFPPLRPELSIFIEVQPLSFFAEVERCRKFVEMVRAWASRYPVSHAAAHSVADRGLAGSPNFGRDDETMYRDGFDKIYEVFWLNVFGPKLVETVGRERILSTPSWRVEELPNRSILLVIWPTASDFATQEARLAQARAHAHLRPDLDPDTLLRTLLSRSATLSPVTPRFHPHLAPLLSRVVDDVAIHERQRMIAEFNSFQPPEPQEWLPASSSLPSDVADSQLSLQHYSSLSELLVALMHSTVPSLFHQTPDSLTDLDYQLWHQDFPSRFQREKIDSLAVPAIGAYLGEVLVRNLRGRWIPREKLEESQVLVGTRVWFPFLRSSRYLLSRHSLLSFSLSHLYLSASLHRD